MKLSTREVLRRVRGQEINVKFVGQGLVSEVVPASGSALPEDKNITVILR
jgi:cell division protein FtsI (penicillin-binding protein 3)